MTTQTAGVPNPTLPRRTVPWWLFIAVLAAVAGITLVCTLFWGWTETGQQLITRYTARLAFLIFVLVVATSALARLFPGPLTRWLRRNRRYLGLSFALAHFLHLIALSTLFIQLGEWPDPVTLIGGGLAYVFVALLALTSNNASVRLLGRGWRVLHLTGIAYIWLIFMNSYVGRLLSDTPPEPKVVFAVLAALGLLAPALRIFSWLGSRA